MHLEQSQNIVTAKLCSGESILLNAKRTALSANQTNFFYKDSCFSSFAFNVIEFARLNKNWLISRSQNSNDL